MKVREIMTSPVTACSVTTDVGDVRDLMSIRKYSAIPVVEFAGEHVEIKGIVTSKDLTGIQDDNINVQQAMTHRISVVHPNTDIKSAARIMVDKNIHHLVAMEEGKIVGMLSSFDFVKLTAGS